MFSVTMPIVNIFAVIFFFMRYYIEKYNFLFVYHQEYESQGHTRSYLLTYLIISVILFQLINYTYILGTAPGDLEISYWFGYGFIILQVLTIWFSKVCFKNSKRFRICCKRCLFVKGGDSDELQGVGRNDLMFGEINKLRDVTIKD